MRYEPATEQAELMNSSTTTIISSGLYRPR